MSEDELQRLREEIIDLLDRLESLADHEQDQRPPFLLRIWWNDAAA